MTILTQRATEQPGFHFFCDFKMALLNLQSPGFLNKKSTLSRFSEIRVERPDQHIRLSPSIGIRFIFMTSIFIGHKNTQKCQRRQFTKYRHVPNRLYDMLRQNFPEQIFQVFANFSKFLEKNAGNAFEDRSFSIKSFLCCFSKSLYRVLATEQLLCLINIRKYSH